MLLLREISYGFLPPPEIMAFGKLDCVSLPIRHLADTHPEQLTF